LTTITKVMAHLPLCYLERRPENALVICFGMGTTFRSLMRWDIDTTAVELVPSVVRAFGMYHADAEQLLRSPKAHVVIDDGRRFLDRTGQTFDVITVDPPPPVEAAGSSLLYSIEFCRLAQSRLRDDGILQHWVPHGEPIIQQAIARTLADVFPHVIVYESVEGWGFHFICAKRPLSPLTAAQLQERLPPAARADLVEWVHDRPPDKVIELLAGLTVPLAPLLPADPDVRITDDRPFNEYFLLRRSR
jgi:predicted membrane-bound spermidine synthase